MKKTRSFHSVMIINKYGFANVPSIYFSGGVIFIAPWYSKTSDAYFPEIGFTKLFKRQPTPAK